MSGTSVAPWRARTAMIIMLLAALGAFLSFVSSLSLVGGADPDRKIVESWRMLGFLVFAGLFVLLALRPRQYPGVWELAIFHKAGMTVLALTVLATATGASTIVLADGLLAVILIISYLLIRAYAGWSQFSGKSREC